MAWVWSQTPDIEGRISISPTKSERQEYDFIHQANQTSIDAPFDTQNTPHINFKIIGSKDVQDEDFQTARRYQVTNNISEKPNHIDPRQCGDMQQGYYSAQQEENYGDMAQDGFCSHIHGKPTSYVGQRPDSKDLSPYSKLPAIRANRLKNQMSTVFQPESWTHDSHPDLETDTEYKHNYYTARMDEGDFSMNQNGYSDRNRPRTDEDRIELRKYDMGYVPTDPIILNAEDELRLIRIVGKELTGCPQQRLKDIYLGVAASDNQLSGWCTMDEFKSTMEKHGCFLTEGTLRLVCSMFVSPFHEKKINYEKILSFLGTAIKKSEYVKNPQEERPVYYDTHTRNIPPSPTKPDHTINDRDVAKLLKIVDTQLRESNYLIDFYKLISCFQAEDSSRRGTLSACQVRDVCYTCRIPLTESVINHILTRCDIERDGQYNWSSFLQFLERVQPLQTGLPIPESKRPLDYAKNIPVPVTNWPKAEESPRLATPIWKKEEGYRQPQRSTKVPQVGNNDDRSSVSGYSNAGRRNIPSSRSSRSEAIVRLERQLKDIEKQYKHEKDRIKNDDQMPWFDRFMYLANALYDANPNNQPHLSLHEVIDITREYNDMYNLQIPDDTITQLAHDNVDKGRVMLYPYNFTLGRREWQST